MTRKEYYETITQENSALVLIVFTSGPGQPNKSNSVYYWTYCCTIRKINHFPLY